VAAPPRWRLSGLGGGGTRTNGHRHHQQPQHYPRAHPAMHACFSVLAPRHLACSIELQAELIADTQPLSAK
jgi:hypothetical protein